MEIESALLEGISRMHGGKGRAVCQSIDDGLLVHHHHPLELGIQMGDPSGIRVKRELLLTPQGSPDAPALRRVLEGPSRPQAIGLLHPSPRSRAAELRALGYELLHIAPVLSVDGAGFRPVPAPDATMISREDSAASGIDTARAFDNGRLASQASLARLPGTSPLGYLSDVETLPAFRRRGHASRVVSRLVGSALESGIPEILTIASPAAAGARFYERLGFREKGRFGVFLELRPRPA